MKTALLLCFIVIFPSILASAEPAISSESSSFDYYSAENIRRFANHLFEQEDFLRAAGEYDRLGFLLDSSAGRDSALLLAGLCYMKGRDFKHAKRRFEQLFTSRSSLALELDSKYYFARTAYFQRELLEVSGFLQEQDYYKKRLLVSNDALELLSITCARLGQWNKARDISCKGRYSSPPESGGVLCSLVVTGMRLPYKSKTKAGFLSAVFPGMGKLYAKRTMDAVYAFILVGTTAWQSYRGFDRNGRSSVQGWIFGVFAGGLYLGNVYGSTVSVEVYNQKQRDRYFSGFESKISIKMP